MVIAAFGTVFAAAYLLWLYQRTAFGTPTGDVSPRARRHGPVPTPSVRPSTTLADDRTAHDGTTTTSTT